MNERQNGAKDLSGSPAEIQSALGIFSFLIASHKAQ